MKNTIGIVIASLLLPLLWLTLSEAQQKPANVTIWCQDASGNLAPCQGGNTIDYDSGGGTVNQGTVGIVAPASGGPVAIPGDATNGLLVNLGTNNDVTVTGSVTANAGTNLNTSSLLTTTAHDAAFGTAGTADTQVRTVQGIASMTPLLVNPGTAANYGIYTEDAAETAGANLVMAGSVRRDTAASSANVTGDNATLNTDANGKLWTNSEVTTLAGTAISTGNGTSGAGVQRVTIASDSTGTVAATQSGSWSLAANQSVNVAQMNGVATSMGNGASGTGVQRVTIASDSTGQVALAAGSNTVGNVGVVPVTSGGLSISRTISAATTNSTNAKGSAGQVYGWYISNINAAARYVKFYNKATAPTCGTDTPVITLAIPGNTAGAGTNVNFAGGIAFGTGIGYCITTGSADNDTGAVAASDLIVNLFYK